MKDRIVILRLLLAEASVEVAKSVWLELRKPVQLRSANTNDYKVHKEW